MEDIRSTLKPGVVFAGKYRIERVLGEGGMGVVLAAVHAYTNDRLALKFLLPSAADSADVKTRFLNEARAAVQIKSEHVGRVMDVDVLPSGIPYMVMEYLEGRDLGALVGEVGPLPLSTAVDYVLQACEALAEAHSLGIVHRDLKPSNLFLTRRRDGSALVKVLDFGISKAAPAQQGSVQMTKTSSLLGSPLYMSPEQMTNPKGVDTRSDVWSMGVVLYELLTGTWPFMAETVQGLAIEIVTQPHRPIRAARPELPESLESVIARCLEKRPEARFASVSELSRAIAPFGSSGQAAVSVERVSRVLLGAGHTVDPASARVPVAIAAVVEASTAPSAKTGAGAQGSTAPGWASTGAGGGAPPAEAKTVPSATAERRGASPMVAAAVGGALVMVAAVSIWKLSGAPGPAGAPSAALAAPAAPTTGAAPLPAETPVPASAAPAASVALLPIAAPMASTVVPAGSTRAPKGKGQPGREGAGGQVQSPDPPSPTATAHQPPSPRGPDFPPPAAPRPKDTEDFGGR